MVGIKLSPKVTWRKPLFFILYFFRVLEIAQPVITRGEIPPSTVLYARYQGLIELYQYSYG